MSDTLDTSKSGFMGNTPDQNAQQVLQTVTATSAGRAAMDRIGQKEAALTAFQKENDISDEHAEAAIKEWMDNQPGDPNFDWDLEEVKAICLRNKQKG